MIIIIILSFTFFSLDSLRANVSLDTLLSRFSWRSHNSSRSLLPPDSFRPSLSWKTTSSYWSRRPCHANPVWTLTNISFHSRSHVSLDSLSKVIEANRSIAVNCIHAATNNWKLYRMAKINKVKSLIDVSSIFWLHSILTYSLLIFENWLEFPHLISHWSIRYNLDQAICKNLITDLRRMCSSTDASGLNKNLW